MSLFTRLTMPKTCLIWSIIFNFYVPVSLQDLHESSPAVHSQHRKALNKGEED